MADPVWPEHDPKVIEALRRYGWLRDDGDGVERLHSTRPASPPRSTLPATPTAPAPAQKDPTMKTLDQEPEAQVKGLPVRLKLGASIDSQMGALTRPGRYVFDADAADGRRLAPANVDGAGNEDPAPLVGKITGTPRGMRGSNLVETEWPGGVRAVCEASLLERAGDVPAVEEQPQDAGVAASVGRAAADEALAPLLERIAGLERRIEEGEARESEKDRRIAQLELARDEAAARAEAMKSDPDRRFVTAADLGAAIREGNQKVLDRLDDAQKLTDAGIRDVRAELEKHAADAAAHKPAG